MKAINRQNLFCVILFALLIIGFFVARPAYCGVSVDPTTGLPIQTTNGLDLTFQNIIDSTQMQNGEAEKARMVSYDYDAQKREAIEKLLKILDDSNANKLNHGMAAFYLGEFHAVKASDILAQKITLKLGVEEYGFFQGLPMVGGFTARDALIKIGTPSIPAVIRNLAESDDAKVRELSLQVLCSIEGDKDIVQLRLQKALNAEKDSQKQARLQAALKSLAEMSFRN
jgi:hypothetical protein